MQGINVQGINAHGIKVQGKNVQTKVENADNIPPFLFLPECFHVSKGFSRHGEGFIRQKYSESFFFS
jgi:hypothetical protein